MVEIVNVVMIAVAQHEVVREEAHKIDAASQAEEEASIWDSQLDLGIPSFAPTIDLKQRAQNPYQKQLLRAVPSPRSSYLCD